jgi:hypothetical protein
MLIPQALVGFFYNTGEVNSDAVVDIMPDTFRGTTEQFAFRVASTFKLPSDFIENNFEYLNLRTLFIVNRVDEEIVMHNYKTIADAIVEELRLADDDEDEGIDLTIQLLLKDYSSRVYDTVFGEVFYILEREENVDPDDSIWENLSDAINGSVILFGRTFILNNVARVKFNLLNAALVRNDLEQDAIENIEMISALNLYTVLTSFESLPNDEEGERVYTDSLTKSREDFLKDLLIEKLKNSSRYRR